MNAPLTLLSQTDLELLLVISQLRLAAAVLIVYAAAALSIWVGLTHTYYAWTGQREKLTVISATFDILREGPKTRELLWKIGGPYCVFMGIAIIAYLTNFLILCPLSTSIESVPSVLCGS